MTLRSFEVEITLAVKVNGDEYEIDDFGNEDEFRKELTGDAIEGLRHKELDFVVLDHRVVEVDAA